MPPAIGRNSAIAAIETSFELRQQCGQLQTVANRHAVLSESNILSMIICDTPRCAQLGILKR